MKLAIDRLLSLQALAFVAQGKDSADAATIGSAIARLEPLRDTYTLPDTLWPSADKIMSDAAPAEQATSSPATDAIVDANTPATGVEPVVPEQPAQPAAAVVEGDAAPTPVTLPPSDGGVDSADAGAGQPAAAEPPTDGNGAGAVDVDPTPADKETIASLDARLDKLEKKQ